MKFIKSKQFICSLVIVAAMTFGQAAACKVSIQKLENLADEMRVHNKSIARVTNEFHAAGKLSDSFHKDVLTACDGFSKTLDGADAAVKAAKLITDGTEKKSALDYARRIIDVEVFPAFLNIVDAVVDVPPEVKQKIEEVLALIRAIFAALQILFADAGMPIKLEERNA